MAEPETARGAAEARRALLADLLRQRAHSAGAQAPPSESQQAPLSENQRAMWFLRQLAPASAAYNMAFAGSIDGAVDVDALRHALQALVDRHAVLRTTYRLHAGEPVQFVEPHQELAFERIDAAGWDDERVQRAVAGAVENPFDLEHGPVAIARLFTRSPHSHVMLLTVHHIAFDGWSMWIVLDELRAAYRAAAAGEPIALPRPGTEYRDFVRWQTELLAGEAGQRARRYWHGQLAGDLPILDLPIDRMRSGFGLGRVGASERFLLSAELVDRARAFARTEAATLYMVLLAAYQVLLHRYTAQDVVLVGSPVSGRTAGQFADVVGCFVNSIVLRADLTGEPTFRAFLRGVRQTVLGALEHQDYPFRRLTEDLRPNRDLRRPPLFQTDFALQRPHRLADLAKTVLTHGDGPAKPVEFGGLDLAYYHVPQQGGQLDLSVEMLETAREIAGLLRYDSGLFDVGTIRRFIANYQLIVDRLLADPDAPVSAACLVSAQERRLMVVDWNATQAPFPDTACVHELFESQVRRSPDAVAVVEPGRADRPHLTYRQLDDLADALAARLVERGVGPEVLVGLCAERSLEMLVAVLGILKAGGAYLPLDPAHPEERLDAIVRAAGARLIVAGRRQRARFTAFSGTVLGVDLTEPAARPKAMGRRQPDSSALAYVVYTSGSTGRPKGVMVEHRGLVNYVVAAARSFELKPDDRVLQFASLAFDTAAEEIFPCLMRGATLVLRPEGAAPTIADFLAASDRLGVTVWDLPTAYWHHLVSELVETDAAVPASVRLVIVGGERALPDRLAAWHRQTGGRLRLLNTYGPTETTIVALSCELDAAEASSNRARVPIGRPIPNVSAYVLDGRRQPVPIGIVGELYIGGAGVARGYLGDPVQTAARFVDNPLTPGGPGPESRLYRTGDLVRYREDGNVEFIGRVDDQVKVRGVRVELGEVAAALETHPGVRDAVVVPIEEDGASSLVAYVARQPAAAPTGSELRDFLRHRLPGEMLPATFVVLDSLPRSVNGKIDRRALPAPVPESAARAASYVAPRTETERAVADIYAEVLGVQKVSVHDGFFDLGGHSLTATRATTRMRAVLGVPVQVRAIFDMATVAAMAAHIEGLRESGREEVVL